MPDLEDTSAVPVQPESRKTDYPPAPRRTSLLPAIILVAFIAIAFTAGFMELYGALENAIWFQNEFVMSNRWTIPVLVLFFSLLVGLCQKYLHAPTVIKGGFVESIKEGGEEIDYRNFPGALLSSLFSLLSGVCLGPEGTIAILVQNITSWIRDTFGIAQESENTRLGFDVAALSSAFNGIIGSPVFTGIFATEFQVGKKDAFRFLVWNLLAGLIGYLFYLFVGLPSFANMIPYPPVEALTAPFILYAILLGVVGSLLALFTGVCMQGVGRIMERAFQERVVLRALTGGAITAAVCYFLPVLMFSGEVQIHSILADPVGLGAAMLLLLALLKILLLAVSFKTGFIGGPIFPILFSCTMTGLALSVVFPSVPVSIFVLCIEAAAIALALGAPLTAILLVVVVSSPNQNLTVLIVTSAVTAMIISVGLRDLKARRTAGSVLPVPGSAEPS